MDSVTQYEIHPQTVATGTLSDSNPIRVRWTSITEALKRPGKA